MPVCVFRLDTDRSAVDRSVRYFDKKHLLYTIPTISRFWGLMGS